MISDVNSVSISEGEEDKEDVIVSVEGLVHKYGDFTAVDGVSFTVRRGEVFSLLGPNGAGKTTAINALIGLLKPTSGEIYLDGINVIKNPEKVKGSIGIVFQETILDREMTVWESMEFHGKLYKIPKEERHEKIWELLELVELSEKVDEITRRLSGGMKRRLEIARALMTEPTILFLDEPTLGLDPQGRVLIWEQIRKVNERGTTMFLTTHYMEEADRLADRVFIMDHGKILISGTPERLKDKLGKDVIFLYLAEKERAREVLEGFDFINEIVEFDKGLEIVLNGSGVPLAPRIMETLDSLKPKLAVDGVNIKRPSLDDVFLYFTGRKIRETDIS
ncbi:MAG: ATP-binding cassette domain-containing protein [Candidatus Wukongarchaeota archaeon]|nr:ATP-binding cassette domain-containing protein [Candidatus Wukongarchaeota archaeon]MDO8129588.1 ATP-binding cassette domain-containing protein [Candidatus Wukongarchaeota archaeon]